MYISTGTCVTNRAMEAITTAVEELAPPASPDVIPCSQEKCKFQEE